MEGERRPGRRIARGAGSSMGAGSSWIRGVDGRLRRSNPSSNNGVRRRTARMSVGSNNFDRMFSSGMSAILESLTPDYIHSLLNPRARGIPVNGGLAEANGNHLGTADRAAVQQLPQMEAERGPMRTLVIERGGAPEAAERLPRIIISEKHIQNHDNSPCTICLDHFQVGQEALVMPCKHIYHQICISQWLKTGYTCPICRDKLPRVYTFHFG